jgi:RNA polymerase sigma-70 factor (ECF subfamily)
VRFAVNSDNPTMPDEAQLLRQARQFDEGALSWIYQNYHDAIYRYLYHHLGEPQTAQDLASEVFGRFLQSLRDGAGPTQQLAAWLYRVAHNLVVDELRCRKHRDHESLEGIPGNSLGADSENPEDLTGNALATQRLRQALYALTEEQREVIVLKYLQGLDNEEVAAITGKTVGAVKALQHRGLGALRVHLVDSHPRTLARARFTSVMVRSVGS